MTNKNTPITKLSYFAAANGYTGFRSYFNDVFDPNNYTALYIIKGGPGTGKSSFMKRMISELEPLADECEAIYCSSDPASLDGIIIKKGASCAGVIDGTSPHSRDPVFPGAVDKIVNLGDNWNDELLCDNAEIVKALGKSKAKHYRCAYEYLAIAGTLTRAVDKTIREIYDGNYDKISSIAKQITHVGGKVTKRLISSYGKDGFGSLNTIENIATDLYSVVGIYGSEYVFMAHLCDMLNQAGASYTLFPSALDGEKADAVFIPQLNIAFTTQRFSMISDDHVIDTSRELNQKKLTEERERLEFLWGEREAMLWNSTDRFKKASDEHLKLERIYASAMDFSKNDRAYDICLAEIKKKLLL